MVQRSVPYQAPLPPRSDPGSKKIAGDDGQTRALASIGSRSERGELLSYCYKTYCPTDSAPTWLTGFFAFDAPPLEHVQIAVRVVVDEVALSAKVVELAGEDSPELILGHHAYRPPYDHDRIGNPMPQRHEPYLDATVHGQKARFLSLFAIGEPRAPMDLCQQIDSFNWCIGQDDHQVDVQVASGVLSVTGPNGVWTMAID